MKHIEPPKKEITFKGNLFVDLNVPYKFANEIINKAELLRTNGIAEEVFLKKLPEKPYTWIANVISIATGSLGSIPVGLGTRSTYEKTGSIVIPPVVKALPLAEANSLLPEIHRRVWKNTIPMQEIICKYCGNKSIVDIELDKMELSPEDKQLIAETPEFEMLYVDLVEPISLDTWIKSIKKETEFGDLMGKTFNRLVFRIPTLGDAIKFEQFAPTDGIKFWRKLAFECLTAIQSVEQVPVVGTTDKFDTNIIAAVPTETFVWLGDTLMNKYLDAEDLAKIRFVMREELPTMPFAYKDCCPSCNRETPFMMEASSFFSE